GKRDAEPPAAARGAAAAGTGRGDERSRGRIDELPAVEREAPDAPAIGDHVHGVTGDAARREGLGEDERTGVGRLSRRWAGDGRGGGRGAGGRPRKTGCAD